jgi:hypothetical protein
MRPAALVLALATILCTPAYAGTDEGPRQRRWHLGIEALTDFPIYVGTQVWAELPGRIRLSTSFGEMPDAYVDTINAVAKAAGAYDQSTADFVSEALDHAFTWRIHIGWRPLRHRGLYFEGGYGLFAVHASIGLTGIIEQATGLTAPSNTNRGLGYKLDTTVHTLGIEVGWTWNPWRDLTLRAAIGFAATVSASVDVRPNFLATAQQPFLRLAGDYLEGVIEKYLFIPTIGLALGWQLF